MQARASGTSTMTHYLDLCENRAPKNRMVEKPVFPTVHLRVSTPFEQTAMGISTSEIWVLIMRYYMRSLTNVDSYKATKLATLKP